MKLIHEYDYRGSHRIVFIGDDGVRLEGGWTWYCGIATLTVALRRFIATTAYYGLWNDAVVEVVNPDIQQELKK